MLTALSTTITDPASTLVTTVVTAGDAIAGAVGIVAAGSVMAEEWWLSTVADTETAILMETVDTTMTATRAMAEADMTDTLVIMTTEATAILAHGDTTTMAMTTRAITGMATEPTIMITETAVSRWTTEVVEMTTDRHAGSEQNQTITI
jgi:hypothetical protein